MRAQGNPGAAVRRVRNSPARAPQSSHHSGHHRSLRGGRHGVLGLAIRRQSDLADRDGTPRRAYPAPIAAALDRAGLCRAALSSLSGPTHHSSLYCTLTGQLPPAAQERSTGTVLEPPSRWLPEIPPLLDAAIVQALELNLQKRQQSIAELAHCLELVRSGGASARTVVAVGSSAVTAGPSAAAAVRLAGVEFPSLRHAQRTTPAPCVGEQWPVEPKAWPRPGVWAWVGMALAGAILVGGGGWLYQPAADRGSAGGRQILSLPVAQCRCRPRGMQTLRRRRRPHQWVSSRRPAQPLRRRPLPPSKPSPVQASPQIQQPSAGALQCPTTQTTGPIRYSPPGLGKGACGGRCARSVQVQVPTQYQETGAEEGVKRVEPTWSSCW